MTSPLGSRPISSTLDEIRHRVIHGHEGVDRMTWDEADVLRQPRPVGQSVPVAEVAPPPSLRDRLRRVLVWLLGDE